MREYLANAVIGQLIHALIGRTQRHMKCVKSDDVSGYQMNRTLDVVLTGLLVVKAACM